MELERKSLGTQGSTTGINQIGIAYISIPKDKDRGDFILQCFRTQTVMIRDEFGATWNNVFISKGAIQLIEFPKLSSERGSAILWQKIPKHNLPVITEVFESKGNVSSYQEEAQFRFLKTENNGNLVDFNAKAQSAEMSLSISSTESSKGSLRMNITNPDKSAKFDLYAKGEAKIFADNQIRLGTNEKIDIEIVDEQLNVLSHLSYSKNNGWVISSKNSGNGSILHLDDDKIHLGSMSAKEPAVLGDKLKEKIDKLIDLIVAITVPTPLGPSGVPVNSAQFNALKTEIQQILSQKIRLD